jgi:ceramide glucosyltransferase
VGWAAATLILRWSLAGLSEWSCLRGNLARNAFWLLPLKDLLSFGLWALSFLGNRVSWGGRTYKVTPEGKLVELRNNLM